MNFKSTLLIAMFFAFFTANAQNEACFEKLSIFTEAAKVKNYDAAYDDWMHVRTTCPKLNNAIYVYGAKILKHKIKTSADAATKKAFIADYIALHHESMAQMPAKFAKGKTLAKIGQFMYDNKLETADAQFAVFNNAFTTDAKTFKNPKSLYTYFKLMVGLFDAKTKDFKHLIDLYSTITEKIESEQKNYTGKKDALLIKQENGTISNKEKKRLKSYSSYLAAYSQISKGVDKDLGDRANCDKLIPLFEKNFEDNKANTAWLKTSARRLASKDCADAAVFVRMVEALHTLEPSANSAYYLGVLSQKKKAYADAEKYYNESISLHTENFEKAKVYYKLAVMNKKRGRKAVARSYAHKTLGVQPSFGKAYLLIAGLYATSANDCGATSFEKRATFWLAADIASKAGKVDSSLKKAAAKTVANYLAKAPSKQDIFTSGLAGQKLTIKCWINKTVTVPTL